MAWEKYKHLSEAAFIFTKAFMMIILIYAILTSRRPLIDTFQLLSNPMKAADVYEKLAVKYLKIGEFRESKELFQKSYDLHPTDDVKFVLKKYAIMPIDSLFHSTADSILATYGEKPIRRLR